MSSWVEAQQGIWCLEDDIKEMEIIDCKLFRRLEKILWKSYWQFRPKPRRLEMKVWKDLPLEDRSIRSAPAPTLPSVSNNIDGTESLVAGNIIKFNDVMGKVPRVILPVCVIVLLLPASVFKTPQSCKQNRTIMFNICFSLEQFDVFWGRWGAAFLRKHRQLQKHEFQAFLRGYQHLSCRVRKFFRYVPSRYGLGPGVIRFNNVATQWGFERNFWKMFYWNQFCFRYQQWFHS